MAAVLAGTFTVPSGIFLAGKAGITAQQVVGDYYGDRCVRQTNRVKFFLTALKRYES